MKYTLNLRRNGYTVVVTAEYYKGFKGSLEEPSEPAHWFTDEFYIVGLSHLDYEEVFDTLGMTQEEFDEWVEEEFTLDSQNRY